MRKTRSQDATWKKRKKKRTGTRKIFKSRPPRRIARGKKCGEQLQSKLGGYCGAAKKHKSGISKSRNLYWKLEKSEKKLEKSRKNCKDSTTDWIVMSDGTVTDDGSIEGINHLGFGESIPMEVGMNLE